MSYQYIIFGAIFFSYVGNIFFSNSQSVNKNIPEISYGDLYNLDNQISKIDVYDKKAFIYTDLASLNSSNIEIENNDELMYETSIDPRYLYNIGNNIIFNNFIEDKKIKIYYKDNSNMLLSLLSTLPMLIFVILMVRVLLMQANQLGGGEKKMEIIKNVNIKFKDIAGLKEVKEEVNEFVDILKGNNKFIDMGCKVPRGAIFYGSPGTGKTLIAKAIAGECETNFISVSGAGFNEVYVGVGQARVRNLFEKARQNSPCVIFIDEIDTLGAKRGYSSSHSENENTLNALLAEMDGVEQNNGVMIFAATNRPEQLDPALLRSGRFDRKIQFNLPNLEEREEIFKLYLQKYKLEDNLGTSIKHISDKGYGLSGADISNLCNEAAIIAVRQKRNKIILKDLDDAFDYIAVGQKRKSNKLNEKDKKCVAYHESGHAFMSYIQKHAESPVKLSIIPTTKGALGYSMSLEKEENLKTSRQLYQQMAVILGGRCSEELFMNDITTGASNDLMKLRELCKQYIIEYGFIDKFKNHYLNGNENISNETKKIIDDQVQIIINEVTEYTLNTLESNKVKIHKLAKELYKKEELNKNEIQVVLGKKFESTLQ